MQYRILGKTGLKVSAVSYGGIVSAGFYGGVNYESEDQAASDRYVAFAIDRGVNYFDVAPSYGNAQAQLGNSLKPYRNQVSLACKTGLRDRAGAEKELAESLKQLHTDHFDIYQLHGVSSMEDVERAFGPGGVMELMREVKEKGIAAHIGFTAHSEEAALRMIELYDFESVLFPFNWFMNMAHGMGSRLMEKAKEKGMGVLAMKAFIERRWENDAERASSCFPKSWCKPIDVQDEAFGMAAMRYTLSLGADTLVPPGNFASFSFAVDHIQEVLANPLADTDRALLAEKLKTVEGKEFF
ncbi:MAG: aldo/keto reductase [Oscillospiraceae bacterium]|nr:aldo/keto reductase [Oscillospiraceae bacterium]